jgi:hypothetical protein
LHVGWRFVSRVRHFARGLAFRFPCSAVCTWAGVSFPVFGSLHVGQRFFSRDHPCALMRVRSAPSLGTVWRCLAPPNTRQCTAAHHLACSGTFGHEPHTTLRSLMAWLGLALAQAHLLRISAKVEEGEGNAPARYTNHLIFAFGGSRSSFDSCSILHVYLGSCSIPPFALIRPTRGSGFRFVSAGTCGSTATCMVEMVANGAVVGGGRRWWAVLGGGGRRVAGHFARRKCCGGVTSSTTGWTAAPTLTNGSECRRNSTRLAPRHVILLS